MVTLFSEDGEKAFIVGTVQATSFENPSNFYKVVFVNTTDTNTDYLEKETVVTRSFGQAQEEESCRFFGHFVDHPRYDRQFQVDSYQQERSTSASGMVNYLSSDKFPGTSKRAAEKTVEVLGESAIDRIIDDPSVLEEATVLNEKKRQVITGTIRLNHGMKQVIVGLNRYGFGSQLAFSIYQTYQGEILSVIQENPCQLVEDIEGAGFKQADNTAEQIGIQADSAARIRATILHEVFEYSIRSGNTYAQTDALLEEAIRTSEASRPVETSPDQVANEIITLVGHGKIQQEETKFSENGLCFSEWGTGISIQRLLSRKKEIHYEKEEVQKDIRTIEKRLNIRYGDSRQAVIEKAIKSSLPILVGRPGTGKATATNGIVSLFVELNGFLLDLKDYTREMFPILLVVPTGRTAKRMNETTGLPASTIYRLLGLAGHERNPGLIAKELEGDLLIVDEMSMVDVWLANTLLKAILTNMQVIFVGDRDQLPSVGPGQVLHDLLQINEVPECELNEIYRQGDGLGIIPLAHEIKEGKLSTDFQKNQKDRLFFASNIGYIEEYIRQIITKAKVKGFTSQDIQVLVSIYRGAAGIDALNKMMQEIFNSNDGERKEVKWNDIVYRTGGKVLQLVNAPELNVFNGDTGEIVGITLAKDLGDKVDKLVLQSDNNEVTYKRNEWDKITLSCCCSIHKAQGSELRMALLLMVHQYSRMLQRNLLYTAVTRNKGLLILLGEVSVFETYIKNESASRMMMLKERIVNTEQMTLTTRTQLEAYEEGLTVDRPFIETEIKVVYYETEQQSTKANQIKEADEQLVDTTVQEVSLFADEGGESTPETVNKATKAIEEPLPEEPQLTVEITQTNAVDPMIGMKDTTPYQFM